MLWVYALVFSVITVTAPGGESPRRAEFVANVALSFILSWWVINDARKRGRTLCYDYDAFVYFAWPVVIPVYLFQTRGLRALLSLLGFAALWFSAALIASLLFIR